MRILIVEDEPKTGAYLKKGLEESGFSVDLAKDGGEGLTLAQEERYDVIVLDVMLPVLDGWAVLKRLRDTHTTPVLFLTARDDVQDRVHGLELGADDYLRSGRDSGICEASHIRDYAQRRIMHSDTSAVLVRLRDARSNVGGRVATLRIMS